MLKSFRHAVIFRLALVGAVLAGFVLALTLAASPELHERLHHHADHDDQDGHDGHDGHEEHECLAKTFTSGGCEDMQVAPTLVGFVAVLFATVPADHSRAVASAFLDCGILEHAPPRRT